MKILILTVVVLVGALTSACSGGNPLSPTVHAAPLPSTAVVFVASDPAPVAPVPVVVVPVEPTPVPVPVPTPAPKPTPAPAPRPTPAPVVTPAPTPTPRLGPVLPPSYGPPPPALPLPVYLPVVSCPAGLVATLRDVITCEAPLAGLLCPAGTHPTFQGTLPICEP